MIEDLSGDFSCRMLTEADLPAVLALYKSNPLYFHYCPPNPSLESVREDMQQLPDGKSRADKFFLGFWNSQDLVAVVDFVLAYPDEQTVFIGLFMVNQAYQGKGIGSQLMTEVLDHFSKNFQKARLAYVKGNPQSQGFWEKLGFTAAGAEVKQEQYTVVPMEKWLN